MSYRSVVLRSASLPQYRTGRVPRGGFFGNVFRAVTGTIGGAIGGFIKGGPIGGIAGAIGGAAGATVANVQESHPTDQVGGSDSGTPSGQSPSELVRLHQLNLHKANQKKLLTTGGGTTVMGTHTGHTIVTGGRRHRRIRWTNTKALGRAERRIHMAVKHMTRYIKWVHPKKAGHAAPKFGRKRK